MKKIVLIPALFLSVQVMAQKAVPKANEQQRVTLRSAADSIQYVLGAYIGQFLMSNGFFSIDAPYFQAGMEDVYKNHPRRIADSLQLPLLNAYQRTLLQQRGKMLETQLFNSLKDKEGVGKLPSGVQYVIVKQGKGTRPAETDSVIIHFKGVLVDGTVFEDTYAKNTPILAFPSSFIPGMSECLQLMPAGSIWELYIPSSQAYGEKGNGKTIPPNSALKVTIELLQVRRK